MIKRTDLSKKEYNPKEHTALLYFMDLHEIIKFDGDFYVERVPGGWIYSGNLSAVFVPFDNEFYNYYKDK